MVLQQHGRGMTLGGLNIPGYFPCRIEKEVSNTVDRGYHQYSSEAQSQFNR